MERSGSSLRVARSACVQDHSRTIPCAWHQAVCDRSAAHRAEATAWEFVILRIYEEGERIPVTIENSDPEKGHHQHRGPIGRQNDEPAELAPHRRFDSRRGRPIGETVRDRELRHSGRGGWRRWNRAMAYPTAAALKRAGNRVLSIVGARTKELVVLEHEMRAVSDVLM